MKNTPLIFLIQFFALQFFAQSTHYWKMESATEIQPIFKGQEIVKFSEGYTEMAVVLDEKANALNLTSFLDFYEEFSISFWWKAENSMNEQTLFRQSRFNKFTKKQTRFIEVFVKENFVFVGTEKGFRKACHLEAVEKADGWFWLTFSADRYGFQVFLQGESIFESQDGTMFRELGNAEDKFVIGEGNTPFIGLIDEMKIFDEILEEEEISQVFQKYQQERLKRLNAAKSESENLKEEEKKKPVFELPKILKNRKNKTPTATVIVKSNTIYLEFWDYYKKEIDGDMISIYLNEEENLVRKKAVLDKRKRKEIIPINLPKQEVSYLIFYAENTGNYYSAATVGAFIEGMSYPVEFTAHRDSNAVIKVINQSRAVKTEKAKLPLVSLPDVEVSKSTIYLELTPFSANDRFEDLIVENQKSKKVHHIKLRNEPQKIKLILENDKIEKLKISARALAKNEKCVARLIVSENGQPLSNQVLTLNKENYTISLKRRPVLEKVENGKRNVILPKLSEKIEQITLVIADHDKPDGDKIQLFYQDEILLEELTLKEESSFQIVTLKEGNLHQFKIKATGFGTSPEPINTPKIQIYANGKLLDEFVFWLRKFGSSDVGVIEILVE